MLNPITIIKMREAKMATVESEESVDENGRMGLRCYGVPSG